jgi:hypothetical protein
LLNNYGLHTSAGGTLIADAETAYCGTSISAIHTSTGLLDTYNESGEDLGNFGGSATPGGNSPAVGTSKYQADLKFWDTLP